MTSERFKQAVANSFSGRNAMLTALRRIASLGEKNVPKYAQAIAREAISLHGRDNAMTYDILGEIASERDRQQEQEGWTTAHDDKHVHGEIACAVASYAISSVSSCLGPVANVAFNNTAAGLWPWNPRTYKPKDARRDLIRAAALCVAEIERLDRATRYLTTLSTCAIL